MAKKETRKDKLFPSQRKNLDHAKLLFTDPEFERDVKNIRSYLGIPLSGFDKDDSQIDTKVREWTKKQDERTGEMYGSEDFANKLKEIQDKEKEGKIDNETAKALWKEVQGWTPHNYFTQSIEKLIEKYNIPHHFDHEIRRHILFDEMYAPLNPFVELRGIDEIKHRKSVTIKFLTKITNDDLRYLKWYVNELVGKELSEFSTIKDIDAKIIAERMRNAEEYYDPLTDTYTKVKPQDIIDEVRAVTGKKIKRQDIYESVRDLKELRQKRFRKSLGNTDT